MPLRCRRLLVASALVAGLGLGGANNALASSELSGTITVSAASSLRSSFTEIGKAFRIKYPRLKVRFNFGSSSALVGQITSGAPADVVALADSATMNKLANSGALASTPKFFARNSMAIAVKRGNPQKVARVTDLSRVGVVSLCVHSAPCGAYARTVLSRSGVWIPESKITRGVDASATLSQVVNGDAQAALVYVTDVRAAGKSVVLVSIPRSANVTARYPISVVKGSRQMPIARAFVDFVMSSAGQSVLVSQGFARP
ncbi:MAG: molybdate ABC transporter substrate-binding protein [Ilumatobacteraceae bacterium]